MCKTAYLLAVKSTTVSRARYISHVYKGQRDDGTWLMPNRYPCSLTGCLATTASIRSRLAADVAIDF